MEEETIQFRQQAEAGVSQTNTPQDYPQNAQIKFSPINYDSLLITHPIFSLEKDLILSVLTSSAKALIAENPDPSFLKTHANRWLGHLVQIVFNNVEINALKEEFKRLGLSFDTICGRFIGPDEVYFRCLDCDRFKDTSSSIYALLCSTCFDNSSHEGHRVLMVKKDDSCSATCDCGDHSAFDPSGFCSSHQPKDYCVKETLGKFPQGFLQKVLVVLRNAFYGVISLFELSFAANEKIKEALSALAQLTLEGTLVFCGICSEDINEAFLVVFGELFKSNFQTNYNKVWHYCTDITAEKGVRAVDPTNPHECSCTLTANLLRIANTAEPEIQTRLQKVLVECAKESSFKVFLLKEFTKYVHFLYSQTYTSDNYDDLTNSKLLNMKAQLYGSEELCLEALNSGHFLNLVGVMKKAIHSASQANHEVYHITSDIRTALIYFLNNKSQTSSLLTKNTGLLSQVLEVLMNFQVKFTYDGVFNVNLFDHQVNYKSINRGLMIEKVISQILEQGVRLIADYPEEERLGLLRRFCKEWLSCFELTKTVLGEELANNNTVSFHPALERVLTSIIRAFAKDFTQEDIKKFFEEAFPGVDVAKLAKRVVEGPLRSLGMVRFLHLVHNFNTGKIWQVYYFSNNLFFEVDILTIQIMITMMEPEDLFEAFVDNFFSYDKNLRSFFRNPEALDPKDDRYKQKLQLLEDFFHFLIFIMNDESCRLNSKVNKDLNLASGEIELSEKCHGVIEKVLVNLLLGHYWVDVPQLKETMKNVLIHHSDADEILHKVAILDEKNKKVRIKDEYQNEFDPYIFYRNPALQSEITHSVSSKAKKDERIDLVSGKYYKNLPSCLKVIQKKIFKSNLPNYLCAYIGSFPAHTALLLRPALKLTLTNLKVGEETCYTKDEKLRAKIQENYLTQAFTNRLAELSENADYKDCETCIDSIQKLIQKLSTNNDQNDLKFERRESSTQEDHVAQKKKLAHQRMLQLKEEFMKKQKMFMNKNALHSHESPKNDQEAKKDETEMESEEHGLTCQFCLDKINKGVDGYGIPVYVSFTNNLYDIEESSATLKKDSNPEKLQGNWWPVVSSCMHHYHEKCFQIHYKNSRKANENMAKLFSNQFETYCSLCNALCNSFMLEEESKNAKTPNQEGVAGQTTMVTEENKDLPPTFSFIETLQALLGDLREKLRLEPLKDGMEEELAVNNIQIEEIFRKGYAYLLESFHAIDKVASLERLIKIYQTFIKEYVHHLVRTGHKVKEVPPLLQRIFADKHFVDSNGDMTIEQKILQFSNYKPEPLITDLSFDWIVKTATSQAESLEELDLRHEEIKLLKEYVAFKIIQLILFCKEPEPVSLNELFTLYKEDEELREDVVDELIFPVQKFILATYLNRSILNGDLKIDEKIIETLLDPEDDVPHYLDKLISCIGLGDSFEKIIEESLQELLTKPSYVTNFLSQVLAHDTSNMTLGEPRTVKLAPRVVELPKNYIDFISVYLKKKCSKCNEHSKQTSPQICMICGDVICLAICSKTQAQKGNLNDHAKQYHLGVSVFVDVQRFTKAVVGSTKNSMFAGKDVYTDKLGHAIQTLLHDPRSLLYSIDFDKFVLNEEFAKEMKEIIDQSGMTKEIYKISKASGYYYPEGNL